MRYSNSNKSQNNIFLFLVNFPTNHLTDFLKNFISLEPMIKIISQKEKEGKIKIKL